MNKNDKIWVFGCVMVVIVCWLVWGIVGDLKNQITCASRQQDFLIEQEKVYVKIGENAGRIAKRLNELPEYDHELAAVWREIDQINRRLSAQK